MNVKEKTEKKVPFGAMEIPNKAISLINKALEDKMVTCGRLVEEFEKKFAYHFDSKYAVAVSSGTDADTLACAALHYLESGAVRGVSEIIIPALTFISTANAIVNAGFKPVFVDVDPNTLQIDINGIEKVITNKTIAIMPVHLMGKSCNIEKICEIAKKHKLYVIEDCAEAHKAKYMNKQVGTFGDMACYSLYAAHIVSSVEGGMITTDNKELADILYSLRNHGLRMKGSNWSFNYVGFNAKMNELEAAVGIANLEKLKETITKRKHNYDYLIRKFEKFSEWLYTYRESACERISPHAFAIVVKKNAPFDKGELVDWYNKCGIDNRNLFYSIPTQCEPYKKKSHAGKFPGAEFCSSNGTHIGIHQNLTNEQLSYVVSKTEEFLMRAL